MTLLNGLGFARQSSTDGGEQDPGGRRSRAAALRAFRCAVECLSRASRGYGAAEPRPPILPEKSPRIAGRSRIYAMGGDNPPDISEIRDDSRGGRLCDQIPRDGRVIVPAQLALAHIQLLAAV